MRTRTTRRLCVLGLLAVLGSTAAPYPTTRLAEASTATAGSAPDGATTPGTPVDAGRLTAAQWGEDLAALDAFVRATHPNPFWRLDEASWVASLDGAPARLAAMSPDDATAEVVKLTSQFDGHSGVYPFKVGFHLIDLHLYDFDDGIAVVATGPNPADLLGARLVTINDVAVAEAIRRVSAYAAHDNPTTLRVVWPMMLMTPEILHASGVLPTGQPVRLRLELVDGTTRAIEPGTLDWNAWMAQFGTYPVGLPSDARLLSLSRRDAAFWSQILAPSTTAYVQYNEVRASSGNTTLRQFADDLAAKLADGAVTKVIVDLRNNAGGNNRTYGPLLTLLSTDPHLAEPGALVVIIGRQTFSAAVNFATELQQRSKAIFVGEPTGGRPNVYADVKTLTLPNSRIPVEISARYWEFGGPDDERDAIDPDVPSQWTLDDFVAGRDTVLAAALQASEPSGT